MPHDNATCKNCGAGVYSVRSVGRWYHSESRSQFCNEFGAITGVTPEAPPGTRAEVERGGDANTA